MKNRVILIAAALSALAAMDAAHAQGSTTTSTDHPKAIGTSQQTADEANRKAVESGDKASFVRTGPTAGERAGDLAQKAKAKVGSATDHATSSATSSASNDASDTTSTTKHGGTRARHQGKASTTGTDANAAGTGGSTTTSATSNPGAVGTADAPGTTGTTGTTATTRK